MRDLTQGPILGNLVQMAMPIAVGMLAQTLYCLVKGDAPLFLLA